LREKDDEENFYQGDYSHWQRLFQLVMCYNLIAEITAYQEHDFMNCKTPHGAFNLNRNTMHVESESYIIGMAY